MLLYCGEGNMAEIYLDIVRDTAQQALTIAAISTDNLDTSLWDRGQRLVRNVEYICQISELTAAGVQIDRFCLLCAAYFNYAGMARVREAKNIGAKPVNSGVDTAGLLEFSCQVVTEQLTEHIEKVKIEKINKIITESVGYFTKMTEAMILSDARNLDDMGTTGVFNELKYLAIEGKNVSDVLASWQKKIDYQYWQARLKESFRFESVRKIAEQRFSTVETFMNQLKIENNAEDLSKLVVETLKQEDEITVA